MIRPILDGYEPHTLVSRSLPRQVHRSLFSTADSIPFFGGSPAVEGDCRTERPSQDDGVPAAVHAGEVRDGGQGRREPLPIAGTALEAAPVPAGLCSAGHGLSVLAGS